MKAVRYNPSLALIPVAVFFVLVISFLGCGIKEPLKIGFAGTLSGRYGEKGRMCREGVVLAVEEINNAGGIKGRPVELLIRNDQNDPKIVAQVDKELIDEGVVAIIGHTLSTSSIAGAPIANKHKVVMISPTTGTDMLTKRDDYFFRTNTALSRQTIIFARYISKSLGITDLNGVYDLSNRVYSEGWYNGVTRHFESLGGKVSLTTTFTSGKGISYEKIAKELLGSSPEGILISAGPVDTAMICQQIRKLGSDAKIIASSWAVGDALLRDGGTAVDGILTLDLRNTEETNKKYKTFQRSFNDFHGTEAKPDADLAYETANVLFDALSRADSPDELKSALLNRGYNSLYTDIKIDNYGDADRKYYPITVKKGRFQILEH